MMLAVRGVSPLTGSSPILNFVVRVLPVLLLVNQSINQSITGLLRVSNEQFHHCTALHCTIETVDDISSL